MSESAKAAEVLEQVEDDDQVVENSENSPENSPENSSETENSENSEDVEEELPKEILDLHNVVGSIRDKRGWHLEQIEILRGEISNHEFQIQELDRQLKEQVSSLLPDEAKPKKKASTGKRRGRPKQNDDDPSSTRNLILACLAEAKEPVGAKYITVYLEKHGNHTKPGVELGRLHKAGTILKPERGLYELPKKK